MPRIGTLGGGVGANSASAAHGAGREPPRIRLVAAHTHTLERQNDKTAAGIDARGSGPQRLTGASLDGSGDHALDRRQWWRAARGTVLAGWFRGPGAHEDER